MPWKDLSVTEQKMVFIASVLKEEESISTLCEWHHISRKTGYKWLNRYREAGIDGLKDRSRAPRTNPHTVASHVVEAIVRTREKYPSWGSKKILARLKTIEPELELPAESTAYTILKRYGLVRSRRKTRSKFPRRDSSLTDGEQPNEVWCADYKGQLWTKKEGCIYPLTITDHCSRYLLCCHGLKTTDHISAQRVFSLIFSQFGLPDIIRTDNGSPFATPAPSGLSRLSVWWLKLGIRHERIDPGKPQQNGSHERMHRTLKAETAKPTAATFRVQQRRFDEFQNIFNEERPHEALHMKTPATIYCRSSRELPRRLPRFEYAEGLELRKVHSSGRIRWCKGSLIQLAQ